MGDEDLLGNISAATKATTPPGNLEDAKKEQLAIFPQDEQRKEGLKQTLHWAVIWGLRVAALLMIGVLIVRAWHLIAPACMVWLAPEKLQQIDNLLFSGTLGALLARYLNQAIPEQKP